AVAKLPEDAAGVADPEGDLLPDAETAVDTEPTADTAPKTIAPRSYFRIKLPQKMADDIDNKIRVKNLRKSEKVIRAALRQKGLLPKSEADEEQDLPETPAVLTDSSPQTAELLNPETEEADSKLIPSVVSPQKPKKGR